MALLAALPLLAALVSAATPPTSDVDQPTYRLGPAPGDVAVVVGVEDYQRAPRADFAGRDAVAVRAHLLALGYPADDVRLVAGKDATLAGLADAVETWLPTHVKKDRSTVFFYFAGDGAPDAFSGAQYLLPADADPARLDDTGYAVYKLYARLSKLRARRVIVVLDAGFSGEGARSAQPPDAKHVVTGAAATGVPARVIALLASAIDQSVGTAPDQGHGLLTYYVLEALNQSAGRGNLRDVSGYAARNVASDARLAGRQQTPQLFADDETDLSLR